MNKFLLGVIALLFVLGLIGYFTSLNATVTWYADRFITVAENLGIIMMLVNGTFFGSRLFKISLIFFALIILGALFKILHLEGADMLLLYPFLGLFGVYLIHFIQKKIKRRTDFLKVLLLASFLVLPPLIILHLISEEQREILFIVSHVLFAITFLDFLYSSYKEGALLKK
jgi:hypothetical protein